MVWLYQVFSENQWNQKDLGMDSKVFKWKQILLIYFQNLCKVPSYT